jgi:Spy/CpxP family protein refolding chaperone
MRTPLLVGATAFALLVPFYAQAQQPTSRPQPPLGRPQGEARGMGFGPTTQRLAERLELTPEQKAQYDKIVAKYEPRAQEQAGEREQMRTLTQQYREARQSGDEAKAEQLRMQMQELRSGQVQIFQQFFDEVAPILNADQKEKLDRFRERFQPGGRQGRAGELQTVVRAARRLDLNDQQKERVRQIVREALGEERQASNNPQASADLAKRVKTQILEVLDANQAAEFERLLAEPTSRPAGPRQGMPGESRGGRRGRNRDQ